MIRSDKYETGKHKHYIFRQKVKKNIKKYTKEKVGKIPVGTKSTEYSLLLLLKPKDVFKYVRTDLSGNYLTKIWERF